MGEVGEVADFLPRPVPGKTTLVWFLITLKSRTNACTILARKKGCRVSAAAWITQPEMSLDLALLGNRALQVAVRRNLVCFPSQVPVFGQKPRRDVQWRLAVLYFIRGWSTREIAERYGLTRERCGQIITDWRIRAVNMGYIQDVTPDDFDTLALMAVKEATEDPANWSTTI